MGGRGRESGRERERLGAHAEILSTLRSSESRVFADEIIELTTVHAHAAIIVGPLRCTDTTYTLFSHLLAA